MSGPVLALVEHAAGEPDRLSLEALALGRRVAERLGAPLEALVVGPEGRAFGPSLGAHGAGRVHVVESDRLTDYAPEAWAAALAQLADTLGAAVVLAAGALPSRYGPRRPFLPVGLVDRTTSGRPGSLASGPTLGSSMGRVGHAPSLGTGR
ncbi:MAG TPA: hypothetical protein VEI48_02560 [Candidatus Sulfotelmatobacter sp.]|nr:hypothetical protein [Candidatus Sulfotelmatobacter sp.]